LASGLARPASTSSGAPQADNQAEALATELWPSRISSTLAPPRKGLYYLRHLPPMQKRSPQCITLVGPMGSGKSAAAMRWAKKQAHIGTVLFVSSAKARVSHQLESRNGCSVPAIKVESLSSLPALHTSLYDSASAVVVDEAQFFEQDDLLSFVRSTMALSKDVVVAGLDSDANQKPWLPLAELVLLSTSFKKLSGLCVMCSDGTGSSWTVDAERSASKERPRTAVEGYVAVCYRHMREHNGQDLPPP
jgi:thymidine kinase